jgi:hypothetical protein
MRNVVALLVLPLLPTVFACASGSPRDDRLHSKIGKPGALPERAFRTGVRQYANRFAGDVVWASDRIGAQSKDIDVRRNAILWKMNAIPAVRAAAFNTDPVAGLVDAWALALEMRAFLDGGAGGSAFGEGQPIAIETCAALARDVEDLAIRLMGGEDPEGARKAVETWAAEHPMRDMSFIRESTATLTVGLVGEKPGGAFAAVESMEEQMEELTYRLSVIAGWLPTRIDAQVELMMLDATGGEGLHPTLARFAKLEATVARLAEVAERMPETIAAAADRQREAAVDAFGKIADAQVGRLSEQFDRQRAGLQAFAHEERGAVMMEVERHRDAVLKALDGTTERAFARIDEQRTLALAALTAERKAAMAEVEAIKDHALDRFEPKLLDVVDHLAWRLVQIAAASGVAAALFVLFVLRLLARRTGGPGARA